MALADADEDIPVAWRNLLQSSRCTDLAKHCARMVIGAFRSSWTIMEMREFEEGEDIVFYWNGVHHVLDIFDDDDGDLAFRVNIYRINRHDELHMYHGDDAREQCKKAIARLWEELSVLDRN